MELSNFYKKAKEPVSHDEEAYFYPLQTSLKNPDGRYDELEPIAEGGMKTVYRAQDKMNGRPVALAVLKSYQELDQVETFFLEARLGALLQHPNIMPVYDLGFLPDNRPFFAMKLVSGCGVDRVIWSLNGVEDKFKEYDLAKRLDLFLKVCDAIGYAHSKGVLHLDIKPANIQVSEYGEVLVCDWGVARFIDDPEPDSEDWGGEIRFARGATINGMIKGTPGFMAPEQIDTSIGAKNQKTDIYALGALLYSLLYLRIPFEKFTAREIIDNRPGLESLDFSNSSNLTVPKGLIAVVRRAMQSDPNSRYKSVLQLKEEITAYLTGYPTAAEEAGFRRQLQLLYQRNKRVSKTLGIALLTLATVSTFLMIKLRYNEHRAIEALKLYEKGIEEKKAALNLYKQQRAQTENLHKNYLDALKSQRSSATALIRLAERSFKAYSNYDDAIKYADLVLELQGTDMPKANKVKALCYFIRQEFNKSLLFFEQSGKFADENLVSLAEEYGAKKSDHQKLSTNDTYKLFSQLMEFSKGKSLLLKIYDQIDNENCEQKLHLAEIALKKQNPKLSTVNYSWYKSGDKIYVDISNNRELRNISCLSGLKIHSLDVSNTSVSFLKDMQSKSIVELDISNTHVSFLEFLKHMPRLKKLTLTQKSFSATQLGFIHKRLQVVNK